MSVSEKSPALVPVKEIPLMCTVFAVEFVVVKVWDDEDEPMLTVPKF